MASKLALTLAAASCASGLALRDAGGCSFTLTTSGGVSYPVGQHDGGQARAGSALAPTEFTLNGDSLTDSQGRGCWWTPPTQVLQCDANQAPAPGFAVGCGGTVSFNGQTTFYECDAGENGEVNIYLAQDATAQNCHQITLTASGCGSGDCGASSSSSSSSAAASSYSATAPVESTSAPPATSAPQIVSTFYSTTTISVPGSCSAAPLSIPTVYTTTTATVTSCASTVSETPTVSVPGPTETTPGPTETVSGPGKTVTASSSSETETEVCSETESVTPSTTPTTAPTSAPSASTPAAPSTSTSSAPVYPTTYPAAPSTSTSSAPVYPTTSAASPSSAAPSSAASYPTSAPQPTTLYSSSVPSTPSAPSSVAPSSTSPSQSSSGIPGPSGVSIPASCPGEVTNAGEFNLPALIVSVDSSKPDAAAGTSYYGEVSATKSSVFDFNIPAGAAGKTCKLVFLFPEQSTLETSSYTFSGSGALDFAKLGRAVDQQTTYANLPGVAEDLGQFTVAPGNAYDVASFDCPAGEEVSVKLSVAAGGDTSLRFFQDYNPCPIGLFITTS